ncbi:MAG: VanZ family protein [Gammaproteobacteria bacterium]|nr:VanZ family protein [Gammaproteobacteria bacterium]
MRITRKTFSYATLAGVVVTITYLSLRRPHRDFLHSISDKMSHLLAYFTMLVVLKIAFPRMGTVKAILICVGYSFLMECVQYFIPFRKFELLDMVANTTGVLLGVALIAMLKRFLAERHRI